ncbi:hypothetical protein VTJ04DRAFT_9698 [Mycothermus thermophilus]|uniref:uncharacterized protein n=1 Tax=Humicola insolens TaxID=85995 RepID=UPI0037448D09
MKGGQVLSEETWKKSGKKCVTEDDPALKSSYYVYASNKYTSRHASSGRQLPGRVQLTGATNCPRMRGRHAISNLLLGLTVVVPSECDAIALHPTQPSST